MLPEINLIDPVSVEVANNVGLLFTKHGLTKRAHTKKLMEILSLSNSQAHRKINGSSNWEFAQIRAVAKYFNVSFESLCRIYPEPSTLIDQPLVAAVLLIENKHLPCLIQIGGALDSVTNVDFVAYKEADDWEVCEAGNAKQNVKYYKVQKIELVIKQVKKLSIAVLDDDEISADNLSDELDDLGFAAEPFYDLNSLELALAERGENTVQRFDAYVIDWLMDGRTAENLIKKIRESELSLIPIFLLTGEMSTGRADATDVARMMREYDVSLLEKPMRLPIIAAALYKSIQNLSKLNVI